MPSSENVPAGQASIPVRFVVGLNPVGADLQADDPVASVKVFTGQFLHVPPAVSSWYRPGLHLTQDVSGSSKLR